VVLKADEVIKDPQYIKDYISDLPDKVFFTINGETLEANNSATTQITSEGENAV
jgi:hypothetical protein